MNLSFAGDDPEKILTDINAALEGRELGKMVNITLEGSDLVVIISRLGKSEIRFDGKKAGGKIEYALSKEKIAFAHRPFKDEVIAKIRKIVESCGGTWS